MIKDIKKYHKEKHRERMDDPKRKAKFISIKKDRRKRLIDYIQNIKTPKSCCKCGEKNNICLDFHHRDPNKKRFSIANAPRLGHSELVIYSEIKKCVVICRNCHAKLHLKLRNSDKCIK